jgi:hypothetical protein
MSTTGTTFQHPAMQVLMDTCPNCGTQNTIDMAIVENYAHVLWNPLAPTTKTSVGQCFRCKHLTELKELHAALNPSAKVVVIEYKIPKWTYSAVAALALLMTVAFIGVKKQDYKKAKVIMKAPDPHVTGIHMNPTCFTLYC